MRQFHQDSSLAADQNAESAAYDAPGPSYRLEHHDLHKLKYVSYQDEMQFSYAGISFHPTYEAKVLTFITERRKEFAGFWAGKSAFWIVGSRPRAQDMIQALRACGDQRATLPLWNGFA